MTTVTSAGTGSGIDFESVITAMVSSKKSSTVTKTQAKLDDANSEISAISSFKSYLSTFKDSMSSFLSGDIFNTYKATTDQGSNNYFSISTNSQAAAGEFDITVKQLASSEKVTRKFGSEEEPFENSFQAGKLTISLGTDEEGNDKGSYTIDVDDGDTLEKIRNKINKNDLGISCSLISTSSGYTMSLTDNITGATASSLSITTEPTVTEESEAGEEGEEGEATPARSQLSLFNFSATGAEGEEDGYGDWNHTAAKDAVIIVDGEEISSSTNTFNQNQVAGVSITVNKVSATKTIDNGDGTTSKGLASNHVTVSKDIDTISDKMQNFCTQYNLLITRLDELSARNTYTDGVSNEDGGALAGDSMVRGIKTTLQSMMSGFTETINGNSIYSMGINYQKDGTLTLNATKLKNNLENNPESVQTLFTDSDKGLFSKIDSYLKGYTKSAGLIDKRKDSVNSTINYLQNKVDTQNDALTKYESSLRARYGAIDALIAGLNTNLTYLDAAVSGIDANK